MARVRLLYFASLREAAGRDGEVVDSAAADLAGLYAEAPSACSPAAKVGGSAGRAGAGLDASCAA